MAYSVPIYVLVMPRESYKELLQTMEAANVLQIKSETVLGLKSC